MLSEVGSFGLLSHTSEEMIDLPPPYATQASGGAASGGAAPLPLDARRRQSPEIRRPDRPLSEVITSPNLPLQAGFDLEDFDSVETTPGVQNQLSPDDFQALVQRHTQNRSAQNRSAQATTAQATPAQDLGMPDRPEDLPRENVGRENVGGTHEGSRAEPPTEQMSRTDLRSPAVAASGTTAPAVPPAPQVATPGSPGSIALTSGAATAASEEPREPRRRLSTAAREPQPIETVRPVNYRLFDFVELRRQAVNAGLGPEVATTSERLSAVEYHLWRSDYLPAAQLLDAMAVDSLSGQDRWEAAWLNLQLALGQQDARRLARVSQEMQELWPDATTAVSTTGLETIYRHYLAAQTAMLQAEPDYVTAVESLQMTLGAIAENMSQGSAWARQRMGWILVQAQLDMARCIGLGPYQAAAASSSQWFQQANRSVEQLIQTQQSHELLRVVVVRRQLEVYAELGRFREMPPLLNYLQTSEFQLQRLELSEERQWLRDTTSAAVLRAGLLAYNYQQLAWASTWVEQVLPRLEQRDTTRPLVAQQRNLAMAYWLQGALQLQAGQRSAAMASFDRSLALCPESTPWTGAAELEQGERLAIMAVAYWEHDRSRALAVGQRAVAMVENAVAAGLARPERLEIPTANLYEMTQVVAASGETPRATTVLESTVENKPVENHVELALANDTTLPGAEADALRAELERVAWLPERLDLEEATGWVPSSDAGADTVPNFGEPNLGASNLSDNEAKVPTPIESSAGGMAPDTTAGPPVPTQTESAAAGAPRSLPAGASAATPIPRAPLRDRLPARARLR